MNFNYFKLASFTLMGLGGVALMSSVLLTATSSDTLLSYEFMSLGGYSMSFSIYLDWKSLLFMSVVGWISGSVLLYSAEYMEKDRSASLFLTLLLLFILSMALVVFSLNFVSVMLGWDGLGLVSFLLVVYYQSSGSSSGATITALSNRVGDGFILLLIGMYFSAGVWGFEEVGLLGEISISGWLLIIAAITKSAQIPFSSWLPRAMAAPTPVSSLVHSSTLVTAGVYLLLRNEPTLGGSEVQGLMLVLGATTMILASIGANVEQDLKKVVALSTLSQLGLMFVSLGMGLMWLTLFHLLMHALFKALLFMCSGEAIHHSQGAQDMRFMGGLSLGAPYCATLTSGCGLALCGVPFLCGFYSKDAILEMGFSSSYSTVFLMVMGISVGLSACYFKRLLSAGFLIQNNAPLSNIYEGIGPMFNSKHGLILLVLAGGVSLEWVSTTSPALLALTPIEKFLALTCVGLGFLLGHSLVNYQDYTKVLIWPSWVWNLSSTLGHLNGLVGPLLTKKFVSGSEISLLLEEMVAEESLGDLSSALFGQVISHSGLSFHKTWSSYFTFIAISLLVVLLCLWNF